MLAGARFRLVARSSFRSRGSGGCRSRRVRARILTSTASPTSPISIVCSASTMRRAREITSMSASARYPPVHRCGFAAVGFLGGSDERRVQAELVGGRDETLQIGAEQRFAAREAQLQHTQRLGFAEDAAPFLRRQLLFETGAGEVERVRAIRALQRTFVGELREQPEWLSVHRPPVLWPRAPPRTT